MSAATALAFASCKEGGKDGKGGDAIGESRALLDPANMDTTVKPGDNFFMYANGAWLKKQSYSGF